MKKIELKNQAKAIVQRALDEKRELTDEEKEKVEELKAKIREITGEDEEEKEDVKEDGTDDNTTDTDNDNNQSEEETVEDDKEKEETKNCTSDDDEDKENNEQKRSKNHSTMNKNFSLVRAIRSIANNQQLDAVNAAVIAKGQEEARNAGISFQGQIQLPMELREAGAQGATSSASAITVSAEGEDVVATDLWDILKPLRAKNVLASAGAKFYGNLVGNVQIPVMSASNVGWEGEIDAAENGAGSFSHKTLSPKRLTAYVDISKQMIAQDSVDVENSIREDLINAINGKLEETLLGSASGTTTQPEGIFNAVSGTTGITTFSQVCDVEANIEDANVLGECKYVMSNKAKAALRSMAKGSKSTQLVYENGSVDGTEALNTSHVSGKKYVYGDFSNLAIGTWAGLDIVVDPYTQAKNGMIRIVVNLFCDGKVLRPEAFHAGTLA